MSDVSCLAENMVQESWWDKFFTGGAGVTSMLSTLYFEADDYRSVKTPSARSLYTVKLLSASCLRSFLGVWLFLAEFLTKSCHPRPDRGLSIQTVRQWEGQTSGVHSSANTRATQNHELPAQAIVWYLFIPEARSQLQSSAWWPQYWSGLAQKQPRCLFQDALTLANTIDIQ